MSINNLSDIEADWIDYVNFNFGDFPELSDNVKVLLKSSLLCFLRESKLDLVLKLGMERNRELGIKLSKRGELVYKVRREPKTLSNFNSYDFFLKYLSYNWHNFPEDSKRMYDSKLKNKNGKNTRGFFAYVAEHNWHSMSVESQNEYKSKFLSLPEESRLQLLEGSVKYDECKL